MSSSVRSGIGQIHEKNSRPAVAIGNLAIEHFRPDRTLGEHGPVDHRDEFRFLQQGDEFIFAADAGEQVLPVHIVRRRVFAEHQLAVVEFQRIGMPRLTDTDHFRTRCEVLENRMNRRISQVADIGDAETVLARALPMIGPLPPSFICLTISS